jgi:hypothetical protein
MRLLERREFASLSAFLSHLVRDEIKDIGIPSGLARSIERTGRIVHGGPATRKELRDARWLREAIEEVVSDTIGTNQLG